MVASSNGSTPPKGRGRTRSSAASKAAGQPAEVAKPTEATKTSLILPGMTGGNVGYSTRLFAQVSLPQRNPGDKPFIERTDGNLTLTMRPGLIQLPGQTEKVQRYPFGVYPRLALTYVSTEAFLSRSPVIDLGSSMRSFLSKLGVEYSGRTNRVVKEQLAALFSAHLSVHMRDKTGSGEGTATEFHTVADGYTLWWANDESEGDDGLWGSVVRLSPGFYDSIMNEPVPVDLKALRTLGGSPLRIDVYLWAAYKMHSLEAPTKLTWDDLYSQFGSQYGRARAFKAPFTKALKEVAAVYPQLNVDFVDDGIIMRPALKHVQSSRPTKSIAPKPDAAA